MRFDRYHKPFGNLDLEVGCCLERKMFYRFESFIARYVMDFSMEMAEKEAGYIELLVQLDFQLIVGYKLFN